MSVFREFRLPRLDSGLDKSTLARPERRLATAGLRREFTEIRDDIFRDDNRLLRKRTKLAGKMKLIEALKILAAKETREKREETNDDSDEKNTAFRTIWKTQIIKRNIPERPQHTIFINIATPQLRQPISARNSSAGPMFGCTSRPYSADKEKRRMHFVSPEWKSEHVSWLRFHKTDLKDIHKLGWI